MKIEGSLSGMNGIREGQIAREKVQDDRFKANLEKAFSEKDEERLREACREFEQLFMNIMYKQMKKTVMRSEFIPESFAHETFSSMYDEELIAKASKGRGIGLAEMLYKQLSLQMHNKYISPTESQRMNKE
ncbi:MAG: flagellar biosynthesis protein FlgJ [Clostridiaceae bacterium]|nr:flagellar biosynthesis protein FlgJ [Clostridiaceae bacterium]